MSYTLITHDLLLLKFCNVCDFTILVDHECYFILEDGIEYNSNNNGYCSVECVKKRLIEKPGYVLKDPNNYLQRKDGNIMAEIYSVTIISKKDSTYGNHEGEILDVRQPLLIVSNSEHDAIVKHSIAMASTLKVDEEVLAVHVGYVGIS